MLYIGDANISDLQRYSRIARYWGRKVYEATEIIFSEIVRDVKEKIVLDPFGGAGCIILEALRRGARGIYIDINPYAYLIARVTTEWFNTEKLLRKAEVVFSRKRLAYRGSNGSIKYIERDKLYTITVNGVRKKVKYYEWRDDECWAVTIDGKKVRASDFTGGEPYYSPPYYMFWYPWGEPFDKKRNYDWLHEFFTNRNLIILTNIWQDIRPLKTVSRKDTREHRAMALAFLSILYMASKMARPRAGSWGVNSYWVPRLHVEYNPYDLLRRRLYFVEFRAKLLTHIKILNYQINEDTIGRISKITHKQLALLDRFKDEAVKMSVEANLKLIIFYNKLMRFRSVYPLKSQSL